MPHDHEASPYYTTAEAAAYLRVTRATIIAYIKTGQLPGVRLPKRYLVPRAAVRDFHAKRATGLA